MKIAKPAKAYRNLLDEFELDLGLTSNQTSALDNNQPILLTEEQLDFIIDQLVVLDGIDDFLVKFSQSILPISLSLYVINDRLWKMMERKSNDPEKMLAMSTIPICTWDKKSEKTSNVKAVKRWTVHSSVFNFSLNEIPSIKIKGEGGDFSGFIEQSQLSARKFGMPESRKIIPNYIFEKLDIEIMLKQATVEIHPTPRDDLDYDYSDHARVFYEHGFAISLPVENVSLKVGKRKPTKMFGDVYFLIGRRVSDDDDLYQGLKVDIWLRTLQRRMG
ncbi:MAG: hypothetical protein E4H14_02000 [Candidatus Thorarchaeota archaeon]|nr:MAG: hypothetical protein E4H14_02000 [Candidatus Thorarchaeota archaeon]